MVFIRTFKYVLYSQFVWRISTHLETQK